MNRRQITATILALIGIGLFLYLKPRLAMPPWLEWGGPFTLGALVTAAVVPILGRLAHRIDLLDRPDERKHHRGAVPLVGGVAVYLGFLVVILVYPNTSDTVPAITYALGLLLVVGVLDDKFELPAWLKLCVQVAAAAIVIALGTHITFLPDFWWGDILEYIITALWLIGLANAVNFLDGIDGLASSLTITAAVAFGLIGIHTGQYSFLLLCAALGGACTGFLPYNFRPRPASAFLGDAGATMLGFALAAIAIVGQWGTPSDTMAVQIAIPLLVLGVPIFDTTFITITRIADGRIRTFREWIEYTGRDHIHHRLLKLGLNRFDTVLFLCIITVVLALSAITLETESGLLTILSLIQGAVILIIIGRFMLFMERRNASAEETSHGQAE